MTILLHAGEDQVGECIVATNNKSVCSTKKMLHMISDCQGSAALVDGGRALLEEAT
jgi:hypothetical protein